MSAQSQDRARAAQEILKTYETMRADLSQITAKMLELDQDRNEHSLVVNTIKDLEPTRRCFRLIGGVLVERTIKEVLPAVKRNLEGIEGMVKSLSEARKAKQKELDSYQQKYNIKPATQMTKQVQAAEAKKTGKSGGVLA
ncbi:hypothetical protein AAMO2058_000377800 [Amorphochlora amoebiformis]|uniref:Prefoldin subunit 2 n=1 Tax=Amorphochlora amoebiformis TaxID=1561963 RepID=A0A7S0H2R4_9EUKA